VLTCIIAKRLGSSPIDNHWALRDSASVLAAYICRTYGTSYPTLQPRVTKTLLRAFLDPLKSYAANYGAIVGLSALGHEVVRVLLLPNISAFGEMLQEDIRVNIDLEPESEKAMKASRKFEAIKCHDAAVVFLLYINV
jgi:transcription initiation factor TFIID subunit 6